MLRLFCGSGDSRPDRRNGKKRAVRGCRCLCIPLSAWSLTVSFSWQVVAARDPLDGVRGRPEGSVGRE